MEYTPMPITRRRRANPPDQPEDNNHSAETTENVEPAQAVGASEQTTQTPTPVATEQEEDVQSEAETRPEQLSPQHSMQTSATNGERAERQGQERQTAERAEHTSETGRRTARGELFRRPPQIPPQALPPVQNIPAAPPPPTQPPVREISLPMGNMLHLAYNPGYTGAEESRSQLLQQLAQESKDGGRARCWNCGSLAIVYDRWNTRSKTFGEVGVAICEVCSVWSVM